MPQKSKLLDLWFSEKLSDGEVYKYLITKTRVQKETQKHNLYLTEFDTRGIGFILDYKLKFTSSDEFMFYEPLVHVPFIQSQNIKNVLILGFGCGASIRECLKWKNLEKITVVEDDKELFLTSAEYLSEIHENSYKNKKVDMHFLSFDEYKEKYQTKFDLIILDINYSYISNENSSLLDRKFFLNCHSLLNKNGLMSFHIADLQINSDQNLKEKIKVLKSIFKETILYSTWIPSICKNVTFILLSKNRKIKHYTTDEISEFIISKNVGILKFINEYCYVGLMNPPKYLQVYELAS
ncbi:hypothetical protein QEJ31_12515 [Pigmentibacter sp. JX0631]|uniref:spermine/spermidine synthase domain-containing protein n=1 Tax=Pigmentibacter sp. JX0631 TaxID=2976982 RepID=UPI002469BC55|nr:hypothetical protein [Pigmentibacter sp. JX0631]WGL59346.1 hypothetical protein QEJ31_12515 [Pigmentibacter sp. JX0631]